MNLLINDVYDAVGDQNIRRDNTGVVHEHVTIFEADRDIPTAHGRDAGAVLQGRGVSNGAVDDVVRENGGHLLGCKGGESRSDGLESLVIWRKDGDVAERIDCVDELCACKRAREGGEAGIDGGCRSIHGKGEDPVNDVDDTTSEVDILAGGSASAVLRSCLTDAFSELVGSLPAE